MVLDKMLVSEAITACSPYCSYKYCSAVDGEFLLHVLLTDLVMIYEQVEIFMR